VLFLMPRLRTSARKLANTAARFDAVGDVTLSCLVGVEVALAPRNEERRPLGCRRHRVPYFRGRSFSLPADPGYVRLASKTGATADIQETFAQGQERTYSIADAPTAVCSIKPSFAA
jgi:hypothetical protein